MIDVCDLGNRKYILMGEHMIKSEFYSGVLQMNGQPIYPSTSHSISSRAYITMRMFLQGSLVARLCPATQFCGMFTYPNTPLMVDPWRSGVSNFRHTLQVPHTLQPWRIHVGEDGIHGSIFGLDHTAQTLLPVSYDIREQQ
jgi:hypothetical protein